MYIILYSILSIFLPLSHVETMHEFHLSRALVKHNVEEKAVQISLHLYIDDFEDALEARGIDSLFICTKMESIEADKYMALYVQDRFRMTVDEKPLVYEYLGKEISVDLQGVWMYLEVYNVENIEELLVKNQLLTEIFEDQQNMMNIRANGKEHYFMLNREESVKTLSWK